MELDKDNFLNDDVFLDDEKEWVYGVDWDEYDIGAEVGIFSRLKCL